MKKFLTQVAVIAAFAMGVNLAAAGSAAAQSAPRTNAPAMAAVTSIAANQAVSTQALPTLVQEGPLARGAAPSGKIVKGAIPAIVWVAVSLIVRFGIPWLTRYAADVFRAVFTSQSIRLLVCRELRRQGNNWGWSGYCSGT